MLPILYTKRVEQQHDKLTDPDESRSTDQRGRLTIQSVAEAQAPKKSQFAPENIAEAG